MIQVHSERGFFFKQPVQISTWYLSKSKTSVFAMRRSELYPVTEEEEKEILKINGVTKEEIERDAGILKDWYEKQRHFPDKYPYEHFLPRVLAFSQFNVETAKRKIEANFTLKNVYHDIYDGFKVDGIAMLTEILPTFLPMPKLTCPRKQRIYIGEWKTSDVSKFNQKHCEQLAICGLELAMKLDKTTSAICVVDAKHTRMELITKIDLSRALRMINLLLDAYEPDAIEEIHVVNLTKAAQIIFNFLKRVVHHKIMDRVHVHNDFQSLYKFVSEEYLPEEYGGTQGSISTIIPLVDKVLLENEQFLMDLPKFATDESLRLGESHHSNMFGTEGTFRRLSID